jgi:hypothetical protein
MKTLKDITLHDLGNDYLDAWVTPSKICGFNIRLEDWKENIVCEGKKITSEQMESIARVCRGFLASYDIAKHISWTGE